MTTLSKPQSAALKSLSQGGWISPAMMNALADKGLATQTSARPASRQDGPRAVTGPLTEAGVALLAAASSPAPMFEISAEVPGKGNVRKTVTEAKLQATLTKLEDQGARNILVREAELPAPSTCSPRPRKAPPP